MKDCQAALEMSGDRKMCQQPLSVLTHKRDSERGASDFRTGFAPVGPFVPLSSLPSIQEMVADTFIPLPYKSLLMPDPNSSP